MVGFCFPLPPKHILQILPDVLFTQPREVGVDIPSCPDVLMPQPLDSIDRYEVWGLPLVNLCQVLAFHKALVNGHDPDRPEGLNPFVKL